MYVSIVAYGNVTSQRKKMQLKVVRSGSITWVLGTDIVITFSIPARKLLDYALSLLDIFGEEVDAQHHHVVVVNHL